MAKKKRKNGRRIGSTFERLLAFVLTEWSGYEIKRTPMSGGWAKSNVNRMVGDVTPVVPEEMSLWPFNMEAKKRENWNFSDLIKNTNQTAGILDWWKQCITDAKDSKRIPVFLYFECFIFIKKYIYL